MCPFIPGSPGIPGRPASPWKPLKTVYGECMSMRLDMWVGMCVSQWVIDLLLLKIYLKKWNRVWKKTTWRSILNINLTRKQIKYYLIYVSIDYFTMRAHVMFHPDNQSTYRVSGWSRWSGVSHKSFVTLWFNQTRITIWNFVFRQSM